LQPCFASLSLVGLFEIKKKKKSFRSTRWRIFFLFSHQGPPAYVTFSFSNGSVSLVVVFVWPKFIFHGFLFYVFGSGYCDVFGLDGFIFVPQLAFCTGFLLFGPFLFLAF
jgi:hypothetical protein